MVLGQSGKKSLWDPKSTGKKLSMGSAPDIPPMVGSLKWEGHGPGQPEQKVRPYL
jgi:hypothetical protein